MSSSASAEVDGYRHMAALVAALERAVSQAEIDKIGELA